MSNTTDNYLILSVLFRHDTESFQTAKLALRITGNLGSTNTVLSDLTSIIDGQEKEPPEFILAERCIGVINRNDDPRFTPEDIADAFCFQSIFTDENIKLLCSEKCPDDIFDRVAFSAAEMYRAKMEYNIPSNDNDIEGTLMQLKTIESV